jgi:hypothetical protein
MALVWSLEQIKSMVAQNTADTKQSVILQQFVNHGGIIFKVYVAGDWYKIQTRPSMADVLPHYKKGKHCSFKNDF